MRNQFEAKARDYEATSAPLVAAQADVSNLMILVAELESTAPLQTRDLEGKLSWPQSELAWPQTSLMAAASNRDSSMSRLKTITTSLKEAVADIKRLLTETGTLESMLHKVHAERQSLKHSHEAKLQHSGELEEEIMRLEKHLETESKECETI